MTGRHVLDASAVLALLHDEPGGDEVEALLDGSALSSVNLSEVIQKAEQHGVDTEGLELDLEALGVELVPFDALAARRAAEMWVPGSGLSLGDRACLALAAIIEGVAVTAERGWAHQPYGVRVELIR